MRVVDSTLKTAHPAHHFAREYTGFHFMDCDIFFPFLGSFVGFVVSDGFATTVHGNFRSLGLQCRCLHVQRSSVQFSVLSTTALGPSQVHMSGIPLRHRVRRGILAPAEAAATSASA